MTQNIGIFSQQFVHRSVHVVAQCTCSCAQVVTTGGESDPGETRAAPTPPSYLASLAPLLLNYWETQLEFKLQHELCDSPLY